MQRLRSQDHLNREVATHAVVSLFPEMAAEEFQNLKSDIAQNGLTNRITFWRGQLIDGRHRIKACRELGIDWTPFVEEVEENLDPVDVAVSLNLRRRHLTTAQRAMVAASLATMKRGQRKANSGIPLTQSSQAEAAKMLNVSVDSVKQARVAKSTASPEVVAAVERGELSLNAAISRKHVSLNSGETEWYTPARFIAAAVAVMGGIDVDPASSAAANKTVGAKRFFTAEQNGLSKSWKGRVWLNPPYSWPLVSQFTGKLIDGVRTGDVTESIVLVNNATETDWWQRIASVANAICFPKSRIRFLDPDGNLGWPLQGQAILYCGRNIAKFVAEYGVFGNVLTPLKTANTSGVGRRKKSKAEK